MWPDESQPQDLPYNVWLREEGYNTDNPWHENANAARDENGDVLTGWHMRNSRRPAAIAEEHSETACMTDRAMDFNEEPDEAPWYLHLSDIKLHWPYIAPAPDNDMYGPEHAIPANRPRPNARIRTRWSRPT